MSAEHLRWNPTANPDTAAPHCKNCDSQVTPRFARVFGDNRDVVRRCPDCATYRELGTGARDTEARI